MRRNSILIMFCFFLYGAPLAADNKVVVVPLFDDKANAPTYQQSGDLNSGAIDIIVNPNQPFGTPIGPVVVFNKMNATTTLEARLLSYVKTDSISMETPSPFVRFTVLVNGQAPDFYNRAGLNNDRRGEEISLLSVYQNLPIGLHQVQVFVETNSIALGVELDPDNYGGRLIVKELH